MKRQQNLKEIVFAALRDDEQSRNSDIRLFNYIVVNRFGHFLFKDFDGDYCIKLRSLYEVPSQDNIKRVRAVIQNNENQYLPTSEAVRKQRRIGESDWFAWLSSQL